MENQLPNFEQVPQAVPVQKPTRLARNIILIITILLFVMVLLVLFTPRILGFITKDIEPIDDTDLTLEKVNIPDTENGYFDLIKIDKVIYSPKEKVALINQISDGKAWDEAFVVELLSKNEEGLKYFADAAKKRFIQNPATADPVNLNPSLALPPLNSWRNMSRISSIKSLFLAKNAKPKEAIEESLNSVKIGHMIQESNITLIEYLVAVAMKMTGLKTIQQTIGLSNLTTAEARVYIQELDKYFNNEDGVATSFKSEYVFHALALKNPGYLTSEFGDVNPSDPQQELGGLSVLEFNKKIDNNYYFRRNKTQLLFANYARQMVEDAYESCGEEIIEPTRLFKKSGPIKIYFEENVIGKILYDVIAVSLGTVNIKKCEDQALVAATQTLFALKAYKDATKQLPMALQELVPTYISSVPIDPFDKRPLKYSLSDKKIYSIHASSTFPIGF